MYDSKDLYFYYDLRLKYIYKPLYMIKLLQQRRKKACNQQIHYERPSNELELIQESCLILTIDPTIVSFDYKIIFIFSKQQPTFWHMVLISLREKVRKYHSSLPTIINVFSVHKVYGKVALHFTKILRAEVLDNSEKA